MDDLLAAARRLATMVRETRDYGEYITGIPSNPPCWQRCTMPNSSAWRWCLAELGGLQTDPMTAMKVVETISTAPTARPAGT